MPITKTVHAPLEWGGVIDPALARRAFPGSMPVGFLFAETWWVPVPAIRPLQFAEIEKTTAEIQSEARPGGGFEPISLGSNGLFRSDPNRDFLIEGGGILC